MVQWTMPSNVVNGDKKAIDNSRSSTDEGDEYDGEGCKGL